MAEVSVQRPRAGQPSSWVYPGILLSALGAAAAVQPYVSHPVWSVFLGSGLGLVMVLLAQRRWPARWAAGEWRDELPTDLMHVVLSNGGANTLWGVAGMGSVYAAAASLELRLGGSPWPTGLPLALQVLLAVVAADLGFYLVHRLFHQSRWLWRIHAIHHSAEHLHAMSAGRNHPVNALLIYIAQIAPLALLGCPDDVMALVTVMIAVNGWLQHADVDFPLSALDRWVATASVHRLHHCAEPGSDQQHFSSNLVIWDRVFGTWVCPAEVPPPRRYGLWRAQLPKGWLGQVIWPFRRAE